MQETTLVAQQHGLHGKNITTRLLNSKTHPDIYKNYSWKTSHSIDVSGVNILVMFSFGGVGGGQNVILPMIKTGVDTWSYREKILDSTAYTISCKDNVITIANTQTIICVLIKLG